MAPCALRISAGIHQSALLLLGKGIISVSADFIQDPVDFSLGIKAFPVGGLGANRAAVVCRSVLGIPCVPIGQPGFHALQHTLV